MISRAGMNEDSSQAPVTRAACGTGVISGDIQYDSADSMNGPLYRIYPVERDNH